MTQVRLDYEAAQDVAARLTAVGEELVDIAPSVVMEVWGDSSLACAAGAVAQACARVGETTARELGRLANGVLASSGALKEMDGRLASTAGQVGKEIGGVIR